MKIHICSDLHIEFYEYFIPEMDDEKNIVVILAGDIGLAKNSETYVDLIKDACERFKYVIMIMGNHEHYKGKFPLTYSTIWTATLDFENFDLLEKDTVVIDNVAFICATLWTDMNKNNPVTMFTAQAVMNDYKCVRTGPESEPWLKKLKPLDTMSDHMRAKEFIFPAIKEHKEAGHKVVVVTHHLPSFESIPSLYKGDDLNGAYASELSEDILDHEPDIWIHGHVHENCNYMIGNTHIICNPRGYHPDQLNPDFIDTLIVEV